jgi:hypothetical protein
MLFFCVGNDVQQVSIIKDPVVIFPGSAMESVEFFGVPFGSPFSCFAK